MTAMSSWIRPQLTRLVDAAPERGSWRSTKSNMTAIACMRVSTAAR
jgi:hypothetical protein